MIIDLSHAYHREINLAADSTRHQHRDIVDALREADAKKARRLMEQHISFGADRLIEMLEARGLWSEQTS